MCWLSQAGLRWAAPFCFMHLSSSPGVSGLPGHGPLPEMSGRRQAEIPKASWDVGSEPGQSHPCPVLLTEASHGTKPNLRGWGTTLRPFNRRDGKDPQYEWECREGERTGANAGFYDSACDLGKIHPSAHLSEGEPLSMGWASSLPSDEQKMDMTAGTPSLLS